MSPTAGRGGGASVNETLNWKACKFGGSRGSGLVADHGAWSRYPGVQSESYSPFYLGYISEHDGMIVSYVTDSGL